MTWIEETIIQAIPNRSPRLQAANSIERFDMGLQQVTYHTPCPTQVVFARRIGAKHVTKSSIDVRFVDGNPEITQVVEMLHHVCNVAHKKTDIVLVRKAIAVREPEWFGKVM